MKRIIKIFGIAALVSIFGLTGCVSDHEADLPTPDNGRKTITFALPAHYGVKTYAVNAEAGESDINEIVIYMFDTGSTMLERIFRAPEITIDKPQVGNPTVTIDVTERKGAKTFFFVVNGAGITAELDAARFNLTTIPELEEALCDKLENLPDTPLLMSFKREVADIENVDPSDKSVVLARRVARFDVHNDAAQTNFTINKILLTNFNSQGYVFGTAIGIPVKQLDILPYKEVEFGTQTDANAGETPAVFYTWPAVLGPGKAGIALEGVVKGQTQPRIFTLNTTTDIEIKANTRFILKAEPVTINEIELTLNVVEWAEGSEVPAESQPSTLTVSALSLDSGDGDMLNDKTYDVFNSVSPSVLKFKTNTFRAKGTHVEVEYVKGEAADLAVSVNTPAPVLVYGSASYEQEYEIQVGAPDKDKHVEVLLRVVNTADPFRREFLRITSVPVYPGTQHKPVRVGGLLWAPCNVGAKNVGGVTKSEDDMGRIFQWGRNDSSWAFDQLLPMTAANSVQGPVSLANYNTGMYKDKFISATSVTGGTYDWITPQDPTLWSSPEKQKVCPKGWKIPNRAEFQKLVDAYTAGKMTVEPDRYYFAGDVDGEKLYINKFGFIHGTYKNEYTDRVILWSSDASTGSLSYFSTAFQIMSNEAKMEPAYNRTNGVLVRCIAIE